MGILINNKKMQIFIHNKKCGGTSIRNVLIKNGFKLFKRSNYSKEFK